MTSNLPAIPQPNGTATLDLIGRARQSLAEARSLADIRRVMELASVAVDAAQRAAKLAEAQRAAADVVEAANDAANDAAAVRIEAQAKAGELLAEMRQAGQRDHGQGGDRRSRSHAATVNLDDLGVSKSESSRWQQVASVPAEVRQDYVDATRVAKREVSTAGLLRHAHADTEPSAPPSRTTIDHPAIAAAARKRMRVVFRTVVELPGFRPESLVSALDRGERRRLLQALDQLPAWIADVRKELAIHRIGNEE